MQASEEASQWPSSLSWLRAGSVVDKDKEGDLEAGRSRHRG
jgi:hypothetical protein